MSEFLYRNKQCIHGMSSPSWCDECTAMSEKTLQYETRAGMIDVMGWKTNPYGALVCTDKPKVDGYGNKLRGKHGTFLDPEAWLIWDLILHNAFSKQSIALLEGQGCSTDIGLEDIYNEFIAWPTVKYIDLYSKGICKYRPSVHSQSPIDSIYHARWSASTEYLHVRTKLELCIELKGMGKVANSIATNVNREITNKCGVQVYP